MKEIKKLLDACVEYRAKLDELEAKNATLMDEVVHLNGLLDMQMKRQAKLREALLKRHKEQSYPIPDYMIKVLKEDKP